MTKLFRIMDGPALPWHIVAPWEAQAQRNHSQSLERLNQRGGLSKFELYCAATNSSLSRKVDIEAIDLWFHSLNSFATQIDKLRKALLAVSMPSAATGQPAGKCWCGNYSDVDCGEAPCIDARAAYEESA